ncbi:hypothetical protein SAY86_031343 [Trapa natans]|uniref:Uncharacterized protein n=1 Tax=Trapa natans TaxID=22666 RepID=A0AAN7M7G3_TRANT|nr:hypothetical protein SAY86_031343 [Trapa natans]
MPRWAFWGDDRDSSIDDAMKFNFNLLGQNEPRPAIIIDRERQTERHWRCDHQIKVFNEVDGSRNDAFTLNCLAPLLLAIAFLEAITGLSSVYPPTHSPFWLAFAIIAKAKGGRNQRIYRKT